MDRLRQAFRSAYGGDSNIDDIRVEDLLGEYPALPGAGSQIQDPDLRGVDRIDVQTATPGLTFVDAWAHRLSMTYQGQSFFVVSKADLVASERAAGRPVDLDDVRLLESGGT